MNNGLLIIIGLVLVAGCVEIPPEDSIVPGKCLEYEADACSLFGCMVESCWCDESPDGGVLAETGVDVLNEEDAMQVIRDYVSDEYEVERAVRLNDVFYNVFTEVNGDEEVFTVSYDGKIIKTICGV